MSQALVVSGGGSHGAFAVGVIKELHAEGKVFDLVAGTSTGALIAPLVATREIDLLEEIYATAETEKLLTRNVGLLINAVHGTEGLRRLIAEHITEERYEKILASETEVILVTVSLETTQPRYWNPKTSGPGGGPMDRETFMGALLASASMPILMPPVLLEDDHHVDGGVRDIAPLQVAIDEGAQTIYAVVLSPEDRGRQTLAVGGLLPIVDIASKTVGALTQDIVFNDVNTAQLYNRGIIFDKLLREKAQILGLSADQISALCDDPDNPSPFAGKRLLNLHLFRPDEPLPVDPLEFIPERMREMIALGEAVAKRDLPRGPLPSSEEEFNRMLAEMRERARDA